MATETPTSHHTPTSNELTESKVNDEVKPVEPGTVSSANTSGEENPKAMKLPEESTLLPKSDMEAEGKQTEPPEAEVTKADGVPVAVKVEADEKQTEVPVDECRKVNDAQIEVKMEAEGKQTESQVAEVTKVDGVPAEVTVEAEETKTEPPVAEVTKVEDVAIEVKGEPEKDPIPDSQTPNILEQEAEPASGSFEKDQQQVTETVREVQHEQPEKVDVPQSFDGVIEKPTDLSDVLATKDAEVIEKVGLEDSAPSNEVDKPEVPEIEVKSEEQIDVSKQVEKPELDEATDKQHETTEVSPTKSEAVVVEDREDSEAVSIEIEKPESVLPIKEQPDGRDPAEKQDEQSPKTIEKIQEPSVVQPIEESEPVLVKDTDELESISKQADKPESVITKIDLKPEEQFEVTKQTENPNSEVPEDKVKLEEQVEETEAVAPEIQSKLVGQVQNEIIDAKPEPEAPEVWVKPEEQLKQVETESTGAKLEPSAPDAELKPGETAEAAKQVETESTSAKPKLVVPEPELKPEGQAEAAKEVETETTDSEPIATEIQVKLEGQAEEDKKVETESTGPKTELTAPEVVEQNTENENVKDDKKPTESLSSEGVVSINKEVQQDKGESSLPEFGEKDGTKDKKKESDGPVAVEVLSREFVVETRKAGDEKDGNSNTTECKNEERDVQNEILAQPVQAEDVINTVSNAETEVIAENNKNGDIDRKLDEAATTFNELVKESQDSGSEAKEPEREETNEDKSEKNKAEDGDSKITEELPKEVAAKPTPKQSNNILSKVKQSLVKAKKAIVGKTPGSKTPSTDTGK